MIDWLQCLLQRLTREELDGIAPNDTRYDLDFFVDVIFHDDEDDAADDDDSTPGGTAGIQSPSSSSIWQHVDQRAAHVAAGGRRSPASSKPPEFESARGSNPTLTANPHAESANFTIDFEDSGGTANADGDHDLSRNANSSGDDPAAQWLGKVQEFEDLEMFSLQPAADNVNIAALPQMPADGYDNDAGSEDGPPKPSASAAIPTVHEESEEQEAGEPRNTVVQPESSRAAPTTVSAAVAAAVTAADDAHAKKAARTAAMVPASDSIEKSYVETLAAGVEEVAAGTHGAPVAEPIRTTSEDSFDNWLEEDVGTSVSSPTTNGLVTGTAPTAATTAPSAAAAAAPAATPDGKSASDDLDDFMASLDDL